ncbi:hypothetical protein [Aureispira anguillae]|uniref:Uncharacterized protein n=1 Tax=Aureispira anguillae TaxID=2864201 RepID=A0A916DS85_9BACT|nr:hypothetical protein [Aureispira anguillae]BDS12354.1 hypothetical protein AsAng_0030750 [Aureispira anguillae]
MSYRLKKIPFSAVPAIRKGQILVFKTKGKMNYPDETLVLKVLEKWNPRKGLLVVTAISVKGSEADLYQSDFENGVVYRRVKKSR